MTIFDSRNAPSDDDQATGTATRLAELEREVERLRRQNRLYQDAITFAGYEWRNQITLLCLSADTLTCDTSGLTPQQRAQVERIYFAASAIRRIAHTFLDLIRADKSGFSVKPTFIDPVIDVFEPILAAHRDLLSEHRQFVHIKVSRANHFIWADLTLLMSACENLIVHAIKTNEPGGDIILSTYERGNTDELSVWASRGTSPRQEEQAQPGLPLSGRIEPGASSGDSTGYYLAHRIMTAHGGCLSIDAMPGSWVNTTLTLPKRGTVGACPTAHSDPPDR